MNVPVVLVTDHGQYLCHSAIDMFYTTISARMVDVCCEFMYPQQLEYGGRELSA